MSTNFEEVIEGFSKQVEYAFNVEIPKIENVPKKILVCGMGGSALPGEILKSIVTKIPIEIIKDYTLPPYIDTSYLIFVVSYSGNTEETVSLCEQILEQNLSCVIVTSGGILKEKAIENNISFVQVPQGISPRMAFGYQTVPLIRMLSHVGLCDTYNAQETIHFLESKKDEIKEKSKEIAGLIQNKIPFIYSSKQNYAVSYKWKINFNENTKVHATCNYFPEFNHNEINGYVYGSKEVVVIMIEDEFDHERIKKRFQVVSELIKSEGVNVISISLDGKNRMERLFYAIWLGDFVSYYSALKKGIDPQPVKIVEGLKRML